MHKLLCVFSILVIGAATPIQDGNAAQKNAKGLEGHWKVVSAKSRGIEGKKEHLQEAQSETWIFNGLEGSTVEPGVDFVESKLKLDPSKSPKEIDWHVNSTRIDEMILMKVIYKLEGERLTICFRLITDAGKAKGRPVEFTSEPDTETVLLVLKRVDR